MSLLFDLIKPIFRTGLIQMKYRKVSCPICDADATIYDVLDLNKSCEELRGFYLPLSGKRTPYYQCEDCGFCFAPEIAGWSIKEFEERIYNEDYILVDPDYSESRPLANAQLLINLIGDKRLGLRHLDYGGGNGRLSNILLQNGWESDSYDPLVNRDTQISMLGKYDLITAFEVFEHVPSPRELMKEITELLDSSGVLLFSTLLSDGQIMPYGQLDWWYASPRNGHISLFSRRSLMQLAVNNGLKLGSFSDGLHCMWHEIPDWATTFIPSKLDSNAVINNEKQTVTYGKDNIVQLDNINYLVNGKHGWFLANRFDYYLGNALVQYGECCEHEQSFLASLLQPGALVIEVGANIGIHTIGLSKVVGSTGKILAFEAQPAIFRVLCANVALNAIKNTDTYNLGCGATKCLMSFQANVNDEEIPHNSGSVSLANDDSGIQVQVIPLDDIEITIPSLRLIKIDVEGMEKEVLEGASTLIAKHRPILYVENDRVEKSQELIEWIIAAGYRLWWHIPHLFNEENYFKNDKDIYQNIVSFNMLCQHIETLDPSLSLGLKEITDSTFHPLRR